MESSQFVKESKQFCIAFISDVHLAYQPIEHDCCISFFTWNTWSGEKIAVRGNHDDDHISIKEYMEKNGKSRSVLC